MILLDTNLLLRLARVTDPNFVTAKTSVDRLLSDGEVVCVVPQNVYEFWAVATRPVSANGIGFSVSDCQAEVARIRQVFRLLPDRTTLFDQWEALVRAHACHGRVSFDARLVAAMRTHGLTRLLTFNGTDFRRFPGITVLDPVLVATSTAPPPSGSP